MTEKIDFSQTQEGELRGFFNRNVEKLTKSWPKETSCYFHWSPKNPSPDNANPFI
jgi:hypothetical protein